VALATALLAAHPARLVVETYAKTRGVCPRCSSDRRFPLAPEAQVFAVLGYV
jgi:hypothetical protein